MKYDLEHYPPEAIPTRHIVLFALASLVFIVAIVTGIWFKVKHARQAEAEPAKVQTR